MTYLKQSNIILFILIIISVESVPLGKLSTDYDLEWIISNLDPPNEGENHDRRKTLPKKEIFIFQKNCPEGYFSDSLDRCIKKVQLDEIRQEQFLLEKLMDLGGLDDYEEEVITNVEPSKTLNEFIMAASTTDGNKFNPLKIDIPFGDYEDSSLEKMKYFYVDDGFKIETTSNLDSLLSVETTIRENLQNDMTLQEDVINLRRKSQNFI